MMKMKRMMKKKTKNCIYGKELHDNGNRSNYHGNKEKFGEEVRYHRGNGFFSCGYTTVTVSRCIDVLVFLYVEYLVIQ